MTQAQLLTTVKAIPVVKDKDGRYVPVPPTNVDDTGSWHTDSIKGLDDLFYYYTVVRHIAGEWDGSQNVGTVESYNVDTNYPPLLGDNDSWTSPPTDAVVVGVGVGP